SDRYTTLPLKVNCFVVGFCGKIYPILELEYRKDSMLEGTFCFNLKQVDNWFKKYFPKYFEKYCKNGWSRILMLLKRNNFEQYFNEVVDKQNHYTYVFDENKCPVFLVKLSESDRIKKRVIVYNAKLSEV